MALKIETEESNGWHVIRVAGEVDLNTSPQLRKAILSGLDHHPSVGVDLDGATYTDSSGVATLVEGLKAASEKKKKFALVRPSQAVMRVLHLARLDALFDIRQTAGEA